MDSIIIDILTEALKRLGYNDLIDKLPKCICEEEERKAIEHHKYSDVLYKWDCPLHGIRTEKRIEEMLKRCG